MRPLRCADRPCEGRVSDDAHNIEAEWSAEAAALWARGEAAYYGPRSDEVKAVRITYETCRAIRIHRGRVLMAQETKLVTLAKKLKMMRDDFAAACDLEREAASYVHPVAELPDLGEPEAIE